MRHNKQRRERRNNFIVQFECYVEIRSCLLLPIACYVNKFMPLLLILASFEKHKLIIFQFSIRYHAPPWFEMGKQGCVVALLAINGTILDRFNIGNRFFLL